MREGAMLVTLALLACTQAPSGSAASPRSSPESDVAVFVRTCESSVYGDLGSGWRAGEASAGPVWFVGARGYADDPPREFSAPGNMATSQKVLVVVDGDRPVTLSVRHPDAALAYDPERWGDRNVVPFAVGDLRARFEPCGGDQPTTQFNGAFLLRGPACVPVEVRVEGEAPLFTTLSFGAGACG
jgi:hypothetical protein